MLSLLATIVQQASVIIVVMLSVDDNCATDEVQEMAQSLFC